MNEELKEPEFIPSWEDVDGQCGMHSSEARNDPWAEQQALEQLVALGYIEPPGKNAKEHLDKSVRESRFYLGRVYLNSKKYEKALPVLQEIYKEKPDETRYGLFLIKCYIGLGLPKEGLAVIDDVRKLVGKDTPQMNIMSGKLLLLKDDTKGALSCFEKAEKQDVDNFEIYLELGNIYLDQNRLELAQSAILKCLELNQNSGRGHWCLGRLRLIQKNYNDAVDELLTAVSLLFHFPSAHFFLGEALLGLKYYEKAEEAFKVCLSQAPGMEKAHLYLIELYTNVLNKPNEAEIHKRIIKEKILPQKAKVWPKKQ